MECLLLDFSLNLKKLWFALLVGSLDGLAAADKLLLLPHCYLKLIFLHMFFFCEGLVAASDGLGTSFML